MIVHGREKTFVGTYDGGVCVRARDGSWSALTRENGLAANDVYSIAEDSAGRLWIGSGGSGLTRVEDGRMRVYSEQDGLPNNVIYQILVESKRSIYCSTNRGVFRLMTDGSADTIISFDRADGLGDDEANGGASLCDSRGRFWIGTIGGASFIDPRGVPHHVPPSPVFITDFVVHDEPQDLAALDPIEDSQYEFVFHYGAVDYVSPQKVRYRSRLAGLESNWSKVSAQRHIRYTNLRPGSYTFEVQARNWGGQWSDSATLSFEVIPDHERLIREEAIERERIEKNVFEAAHVRLQQLAEELRAANEKLRDKEMILETQAREDPLTGLLNRRYLDLYLRQEYERAVRFHRPLTVVITDLDHFKSVNDVCGHAGGDEVLRTFSLLLRNSVRSVDVVARYGGEEFVILLPETEGRAASVVCEKIRGAIEEYPWHEIEPSLRVTISIGYCDIVSAESAEEMLRVADGRLFEAKRSGRNRVCGI